MRTNMSDGVESGFGCFDYALDKTKSSVESSTGVGHAKKMKAFVNLPALRRKAEKAVRLSQRDDGGGTKEKFEEDVAAMLKKWSYTSWRLALQKEKRMKVLRSLQRNLRDHGKQRREQRQLAADAALA